MDRMVQVYTLGGFKIVREGQPISDFGSRKTEALIVYLACTRKPQAREVLANLLWDERSQRQALSNLRVVIASLRKHLGDFFEITRDTVALNPGAEVWTDVGEFETRLNTVRAAGGVLSAAEAGQVGGALDLYQGEFLEGFYVRESSGFDDWLVRERERLHRMAVGGLHDLVANDLQSGDYPAGLSRASRLLALDPLNEAAHRQMMQLLAYDGRRSEALAQYAACRQLLRDELGIEPAAATKALNEKIRSGEVVRDRPPSRAIRGYELQEQIGSGSYGAVYRAYQPSVGREVAVKVILPQYANDPDFIRRFEVEAQTVAHLEHPWIVPLYDYWREPDGAYLVMRFLKGGSLEEHLANGPLEAVRTIALVEQVAEGLALAHQHGVVHRDLKPANILLDEAGNAYLTDFGIAKVLGGNGRQTQPGALIGSPAYMSPEQIRNEPVTPRADIYCLGLILYELLAGQPPFPDGSLFELVEKHLYQPVPSLRGARPDLPEAVDQVIQRATAKDPQVRFPDVQSLAAAFQRAMAGLPVAAPEAADQPGEIHLEVANPYKGLAAFQESDAELFYGREALIERLLARLGEAGEAGRFLAVVGPSGSGKSSVVKAGLIPALRRGVIAGAEQWFIVEMLPGTHPLEELEAALLRVAVNPPASLRAQLAEDPRGLTRAVKRALPGGDEAELLLVIDQFEETFTLVEDRQEARFFLDSLVAAVSDPRGRVRVVITLRADFYDRPLMIPDFSQLVQAGTEVVLPLTAEELVRAIQEPALRVGAKFEDGLVARLAAEVNEQPGALPLLQYSLTELFEQREGNVLTKASYEAIGGVLGALSKRAEEVYQVLEASEQESARQVFLRLVTLGEGVEDTRRRVLRAELEALEGHDPARAVSVTGPGFDSHPGSVAAVLDVFGKARLLSFDRDLHTHGPTVEVAHEALLREWARLKEWLEQSRADVRMQRALGSAATEWERVGRDPDYHLRGARLDLFLSWTAETDLALTEEERLFLEASLADRQARREAEAARQRREADLERRSRTTLRGLVVVFALAAVVATVLGLYAFNQQGIAEAEADGRATQQAIAEGEAIARTTQQAIAEAEADARATQQALAENEAQARAAAEAIALQERDLAQAQRLAAEANSLMLNNGDPNLIALLSIRSLNMQYTPAGDAMLSSLTTLEAPPRELKGHRAQVWGLDFSPDGKYLVTTGRDKTARLWDVAAGETIHIFQGQTGEDVRFGAAAFSPDGSYLLTSGGNEEGDQDKTARLWDVSS